MATVIRVGIAGFDLFFAALGALRELEQDADVKLVIAAHHDVERIRPLAEKVGAQSTSDYRSVVDADIDLLITGCPTSQNADLVIAAAEQGKHILSVKPFAMDLKQADAVVAAVQRAGVHFMCFDATWRFNPLYQQAKALLTPGELGRPLSAFCLLRSALPAFVWFGNPFEAGRSWWLDPAQAPGGGWIDHAIYYVDALRWMFGSEVARVSGEVANLRHTGEAQEDFGVATLVFHNGSIATVEVTWHIEGAGMAMAFQLVGSEGQLLSETTVQTGGQQFNMRNDARRIHFGDQTGQTGWQAIELPQVGGQVTSHMLAVLRGETTPIADEDDARANLAACLAFYQAAREHRSIDL
jgi:predicted dehydrogenase